MNEAGRELVDAGRELDETGLELVATAAAMRGTPLVVDAASIGAWPKAIG